MVFRLALVQGLLAVLIGVLFGTGLLSLGESIRPFVAAAGILFGVSLVFLLWKLLAQPRLHGFRFNLSQDPEVVERQLKSFPVFYDTGDPAEFPWVEDLEKRGAAEIIREVREFVAGAEGEDAEGFKTAYHNELLSLSPTWKSLNLISYGTVNSTRLPKTREILSGLPNVFTCNLSKLKAETEVRPHAGESTCYIRCHLGIDIPAEAPVTALHVGGQERSWEEGKVIAFCDGHWHGARNLSIRDRYVLIFDVMPERLGWYTKEFCSLMVAFNVVQSLLPGRFNLHEPLWKPPVLLGMVLLATVGLPMQAGFYLYFRYLCRDRSPWIRRLARRGFGFYY